MPKRVVDLRTERPLLDIASFGRRGPEAKLTPSEVHYVARTARRVPEVMIKVSGGARTLQGVGAHFDYIGRKGRGEIETDMGESLNEQGFEKDLIGIWTWMSVAATPIEPSRTDAGRPSWCTISSSRCRRAPHLTSSQQRYERSQ